MKRIKDVYGCLSCFLRQKTTINIKRKLGETIEDEIIYELKKPMYGFFEREMLKSMLIDAGFEEFSYIASLTKNFLELIKRKKQYCRLLEYHFNLKLFCRKKCLSIIHLVRK